MSKITAIREKVGHTIAPQRYTDDDDVAEPSDKTDLETWTSEARPGLGHRLKRAKRTLLLYGLLLGIGIALLYFWSRPFVVGVVGSPVTQAGAAGLGVFLLGLQWGSKRQRSLLESCAWLAVRVDDGSELFLGEVRTDGDSRVFIPYKGFDWLGFRSRQLTLGELGASLARAAVRNNPAVDMDDPARVRVDDALVEEQTTAFGTVLVAQAEAIEPDPFAEHSDLYLSPPDTLDEDMAQSLNERLRQLREMELPKLQSENEMLRQRQENLQELLKESDDERVDTFINRLGEVSEVMAAANSGGGTRERDRPSADELMSNGDGMEARK